MAKQSIITVPNPLLREQSKPVDPTNPQVHRFIKDMEETLIHKSDPPGVGLSAVQVGKLWQILLLYLPHNYTSKYAPNDANKSELTIIMNPKIVAQSKELTLGPNPKKPLLEGCLSIPNLYGPVLRPEWVEVEYDTLDLRSKILDPKKIHTKFSNFTARVYLHEADHFHGVLFTDYTLSQNQPLFFDTGDGFEPVVKPSEIIKW